MRQRAFFLLLICLHHIATITFSQTFNDLVVDPNDNGKILARFLEQAERDFGIDVVYEDKLMRSLTLTGIEKEQRLTDYLDDRLTNLSVFRYDDKITVILDKKISERHALKKENFVLFQLPVRHDGIVNGIIRDAVTQDRLIAAKVYLPASDIATVSDENGGFQLKLHANDIVVVDFEYIGYETNRLILGYSPFGAVSDLNVALLPESKELQGVTITADRIDENVTSKITGVENMNIAVIKSLPAFLGEVDPIRSLTTLPGVSTIGELASGFHVRGGESGQNLVLQDGATIYNPSHLFGFFSAFNPDMVSNVTLYKGGGPANFGSRISSVLDVSLRNGDAGKHSVSGGVGMVSSRLSVEGPIVRNRSSYLIGGRISYPNWLVKATDNISLRNSAASFYDVTGKIFHTINERNYITISGYHSYDNFKFATDSTFNWRTSNLSLKWDHTFHEDTYSALTLVSSNYSSEVNSISEIEGFKYHNAIHNIGVKFDVTQVLGDESKFLVGVESSANWMEPGKLTPTDQYDNVVPRNMQDQRSLENAAYIQWDKNISEKWSLSAGVRYGYFLRFGKEDIYTFNYEQMEGRYPSVEDTVSYSTGEVIQRYSGLEPRISLRYLVTDQSSVKASYYRGYQYLHMISNTSASTPQDYWITSGPHIAPQRGDQYSLGFFQNLDHDRYEFSVEGFYKNIENAVDYMEGADITLNPILEAGLSQGKGLAYGVETLLKKSTGRLNGWLSYTWARSLRKFSNEDDNVMINGGSWYPSAFDQPHHLSVVLTYRIGERAYLSGNFNYSTGRPITIPISKFSYDAYLAVLNFSERNDYRIPDYHRLDLSLTIKGRPRVNKQFNGEWVFSVFNVYSRKNTYSITFDRYGTASKLSVLGSIFPSVTYNFRF